MTRYEMKRRLWQQTIKSLRDAGVTVDDRTADAMLHEPDPVGCWRCQGTLRWRDDVCPCLDAQDHADDEQRHARGL